MHIGQTAVLRFSAFSQRTTPEIDGTVPSSRPTSCKVQKTNERHYSEPIAIPKTVVSYLMKPLNDQIMKAFRER